MFDALCKGIFQSVDKESHKEQIEYRTSLQEPAKALHESYATQVVCTPKYEDEKTRHAYLLRYFPFYSQLLPEILEKNNDCLPKKKHLTATFFGCGPAPELIGLLQFLEESNATSNVTVTKVTANLIDIASDHWMDARNIVMDFIAPKIWPRENLDVRVVQANIADPTIASSSAILTIIRKSNLVVFQNCLNEIKINDTQGALDNIKCILNNIKCILKELPNDSMGVIIDRAKYSKTEVIFELLKLDDQTSQLKCINGSKDFCKGDSSKCKALLDIVPDIITENLFWRRSDPPPSWDSDGLILANKIDYVFQAFQKN